MDEYIKKYSKQLTQSLYDIVGFPIRIAFPDLATRLGFTSIHAERWNIVDYYAQGFVLDVGCGGNEFIRKYNKNGYGIDPYFVANADIQAKAENLPLKDNIFDAVTFIACFNHIPDRKSALQEASRVIKDNGIVVITMLTPLIGWLNHRLLFWLSEDNSRKREVGERDGITYQELIILAKECNLNITLYQKFIYGLNHLYVFKKNRD